MKRLKPIMSQLHHNRAKAVACPQCKAEIGMACVRADGRNGSTHVARVLRYEEIKGYGISIKLANKIDKEFDEYFNAKKKIKT